MVAQSDAKSADEQHRKEECDLEPVQAKKPEVERDGGQGKNQRPDEKGTGYPIDAVQRQAKKHPLRRRCRWPRAHGIHLLVDKYAIVQLVCVFFAQSFRMLACVTAVFPLRASHARNPVRRSFRAWTASSLVV